MSIEMVSGAGLLTKGWLFDLLEPHIGELDELLGLAFIKRAWVLEVKSSDCFKRKMG